MPSFLSNPKTKHETACPFPEKTSQFPLGIHTEIPKFGRHPAERKAMQRSKASAVLARLKEFDKKYKLRGEKPTLELGVSEVIGTNGATSKSKLDIRIPDTRTSGCTPDESTSSNRVAALSPSSNRVAISPSSVAVLSPSGQSHAENSVRSESSAQPVISSASGLSTGSSEKVDRYYRSDTFEDVSTSSIRSGHAEDSGEIKEKQMIELVSPKPMQSVSECDIELDEELSEYIKTIDSLDRDTVEMTPITILKPTPKQPGTPGKRPKSSKPAKTVPKQSIIELYKKEDQMIDVESKKSSSCEEISNSSSPSIPPTEPPVETDRERSDLDISSGTNQSFHTDQKSLPATQESLTDSQSDTSKKQDTKEIDRRVQKEEKHDKIKKSVQLLEETPEDELLATEVLRKLNRQAINAIVKRHKAPQNQNSPEITESIGDDASISPRKNRSKKGKQISRTSNVKLSNSRRERVRIEKSVSKESQHAKKRLIAKKLEQERQDLSNFLQELDRIHFLDGAKPIPKAPLIRPLELPNVEAFEPPDGKDDAILRPMSDVERIGEKLCEIQLWLKDQYALYREYSKVAQIVNAKYAPSNLEDAKQVIRQLKSRTKKIVPTE